MARIGLLAFLLTQTAVQQKIAPSLTDSDIQILGRNDNAFLKQVLANIELHRKLSKPSPLRTTKHKFTAHGTKESDAKKKETAAAIKCRSGIK